MKRFLILLALAVCAYGQTGLGKSTITCLDKDGDGYGVGPGCLGPDADDNDVSVHTGAQAISKRGSLAAFLAYRQYNPTHIWYMAPASASPNCQSSIGACIGNDSTGVEDDINHPFRTWSAIQARVAAGHMVMMRDAWTDYIYNTKSGSAGSPVIYMSFPGEAAFLNRSVVASSSIGLLDVSWIVVDGIRATDYACFGGGSTAAYPAATTFHDNIFRNLECVHGGGLGGIALFNGLVNVTIEDCVFHDNVSGGDPQHEIYIGSRTIPSSNVTVRRNILYNSASYPIFQFNGRVTNLFLEQNLLYNGPGTTCISLMEGVSNSFIRNNVCFNSAGALAIVNYDGTCYDGSAATGICPYDQTYNLIENNTFYTGARDSSGQSGLVQPALAVLIATTGCPHPYAAGTSYSAGMTALYPYGATGGTIYTSIGSGNIGHTPPSAEWTTGAICDMTKVGDLGHNTYRNNIFVANSGGSVNYSPANFRMCTIASTMSGGCTLDTGETTLATSTFNNNIFWSTGGGSSGAISTGPNPSYGYTHHHCADLPALTASSVGCINSDPLFVASDPSAYWATPSSFNLALNSGSPALGAGTAVGAPAIDLWGTPRANPPAIGAYESAGQAGGSGPAVSALSCAPSSLASGSTATCTVTLGQPAGATAAVVAVSSSSQSLTVPTTVSVAANAIGATFTATAGTISSGQAAVVNATLNGSSQTFAVTLVAPTVLSSLSCSPASLTSGATSTCAVTVTQPAGSGGVAVALASGSSALSVPATVSIPAGVTTATFAATAGAFSSTQTAVVTATLNGSSQTASVILTTPTQGISVSCTPASLASGATSTCTVTLTQPAGAGGATLALASSTQTLTVPASMSVATGTSTATFSATAGTIAATQSAVLTATLNGASSTASITLTAGGGSTQSWQQLSSTMLTSVCPANNFGGLPYPFASMCGNVVNAWSGGTADTRRNRLVIWGGGHGDYQGNEIYALNLTAAPPTMTRLTNPSAWNYSVSYEVNPDGTPTSRHTYNDLVYLPVQDALFSFSGGLPSGGGTNHTWMFTFADNTWHAQDPVKGFNPTTIASSVTGAACVYDPNTQTVFCIDGNTSYLLQYNPATNTYTKLSIGAAYPLAATPAIDPVRKLMIFMGNASDGITFKVSAVDISGNDRNYTVQDWTSQVTGCAGMSANWPGLVYDSAMSKFVGYPNQGGTVYIFDAGTKTCVAQTFASGPQTAAGTWGTFGRFQYFPSLNTVVLVNAANQNAYTLRLSSTPVGTSSACDLNGDGTVDALDVQIAINQALGISVCSTAALTGNGQCTVIGVQRVINASLGGACIVGP